MIELGELLGEGATAEVYAFGEGDVVKLAKLVREMPPTSIKPGRGIGLALERLDFRQARWRRGYSP